MSLRIGKSSGALLMIFVLIAVNATFFTIPGISDTFSEIATYHDKKLVFFIVIAIFSFLCFIRRKFLTSCISWNLGDSYGNIVKYYLFIIVITMLLSCKIYSAQSLYQTFTAYYYFFNVIAYFFIIYWIKEKQGFCEKMCKLIAYIGTLYALYMILAKVLYIISDETMVIFSTTTAYMQVRSGGLRLAQCGDMVGFSGVLMFCFWLKEKDSKKKLVYIFYMIINVLCLFWIVQTRAFIATIILTYICTYLFCGKWTQGKGLAIVAGMIIGVLMIGQISNFISSFSLKGEYYYSTFLRLSGYTYFLSKTFSNGIIGIGLIANNAYYSILHGTGGISLSITDVGYCGFIGEFGILGILFLIFWFVTLMKDIVKIKRLGMETEMCMTIALFIYTTVGFWSLCFSDAQRSLYFPIYIAILSYEHSMLDIKNEK